MAGTWHYRDGMLLNEAVRHISTVRLARNGSGINAAGLDFTITYDNVTSQNAYAYLHCARRADKSVTVAVNESDLKD